MDTREANLAAMMIRNQVHLGRLQSIWVAISEPASLEQLLPVIDATAEKVEKIHFQLNHYGSLIIPPITSASTTLPKPPRAPKLKHLTFTGWEGPNPHVEYLLVNHATTLKRVTLTFKNWSMPNRIRELLQHCDVNLTEMQ